MTPPFACALPLSATYRSPRSLTVRWRARPRLSATTNAQNPSGTVMPPLSGSHDGSWAAATRAPEPIPLPAPNDQINADKRHETMALTSASDDRLLRHPARELG